MTPTEGNPINDKLHFFARRTVYSSSFIYQILLLCEIIQSTNNINMSVVLIDHFEMYESHMPMESFDITRSDY